MEREVLPIRLGWAFHLSSRACLCLLFVFSLCHAQEKPSGTAWRLYEEKRYEEACAYADSVLTSQKLLADDEKIYLFLVKSLSHEKLGDYGSAIKAEQAALEILEKSLPADHPDIAMSCNNLGLLYHSLGKYTEAEEYYKRALEIYEKSLPSDHPDIARSCENLGLLYHTQGKFAEAEVYYKRALEIKEKSLQSDHPDIARSYGNLGGLYLSQGRFAEAEAFLRRALEIQEKSLPADHPDIATSYNNLGGLYNEQGKFAEAEEYLRRALEIKEKSLPSDHPYIAAGYHNLGFLYYAQGKYTEAETYFLRAYEITERNLTENFVGLSEKEQRQYYEKISSRFEFYNSYYTLRANENPAILCRMYDQCLAMKGRLYASTRALREVINTGDDTELKNIYRKWSDAFQLRAKLLSTEEERQDRGNAIDSLSSRINEYEKELSRRSQAFARTTEKRKVFLTDVRNSLREGEAAVEIVRFQWYTDHWTDTVCYAALIVDHTTVSEPKLVLMENGNEIEERGIELYRQGIGVREDRYWGMNQESLESAYELMWYRIDSALGDAKTVYLSSDGVYHQINVETLGYREGDGFRYVWERREIRPVSNTRVVAGVLGDEPVKWGRGVVLVGGPDYDLGGKRREELAARYRNRRKEEPLYAMRGEDRGRVGALPGAKREVEEIGNALRGKGIAVEVDTGALALEEAVKAVRRPSILHLATHGFFLKDEQLVLEYLFGRFDGTVGKGGIKVGRYIEEPLLRSGVLFAGVNKREESGENCEDGVLYALEAQALDLEGTDVVVLSACETGLGAVRSGEGVYGLQRSFQLAGAKKMVMSLWKVDDEATRRLMQAMYELLLSGRTVREAFRSAKARLREGEYADPYYWGAFVLLEG